MVYFDSFGERIGQFLSIHKTLEACQKAQAEAKLKLI